MAFAKKTEEVIEIKPVEEVMVKVRIVGDSPLIVHKWSEKAKKEMLDSQQGKKAGKKKDPKDPVKDFIDAAYWIEGEPAVDEKTEEGFEKAVRNGARFGFPAVAVKKAAVSAAYRNGWSKDKVSVQSSFFIDTVDGELIEICGDAPVMREDMVRVGMGTADLRYRPEFKNWYSDITIRYNKNGIYSLDKIINMINLGGYACGLGENRVEKGGLNGKFHIDTAYTSTIEG